MKKLMILCFIILFSVLSALSCFNFAFDTIDQIESDKVTMVIEKPEDMSNTDFLTQIDRALAAVNADIMYRHVEDIDGKTHYQYYKTNHTTDFLKLSADTADFQLSQGECISTTAPTGYSISHLKVSSLMQDISFYTWEDAEQHELSAGTFYVKMGQQSKVYENISQLGYQVTLNPTAYISGKFSVVLFGFVPAFMLIASMVFYSLSNGKKNVLKKMEGYTTYDILKDEAKTIFPAFSICFLLIEAITLIIAAALYQTVLPQYFIFSAPNIVILCAVVLIGFGFSTLFIRKQNSAEHIKGKVPRRGIYITTILAKGVFVAFIIFFLSIAVRNVAISYHTIQTSQFLAEKMSGYVTVPVNTSNASMQNKAENYKEFYTATVERYHGILIDASNYEYSLISGRTPAEEFNQPFITVNENYLSFNPIYNLEGKQVISEYLSQTQFNVLLPASRADVEERYREYVKSAYSMEAHFITYDETKSPIYSYNARTGTGGSLDAPVVFVVREEQLEGIMVLSYCSKGSYILNVPTEKPYDDLLPILDETGIAAVTLETPTVTSTFEEMVNHQSQMLILYGSQSIVLLIGLFCLILFSAKLYCENYKSRIACCLIEGYSILLCIQKHLIITIVYYVIVIAVLRFASIVTQVSLNYTLLLIAFVVELIITMAVSRGYMQRNLYQIVKGAD